MSKKNNEVQKTAKVETNAPAKDKRAEKIEKFRDDLRIRKQVNPALRKVQVALRAIKVLKSKPILADHKEKLLTAEKDFQGMEEILWRMIPEV